MNFTRLSDRRTMTKVGGKTVYVNCLVYPVERENPMPGEYRWEAGTYEVDDGEEKKRVTAVDPAAAVNAFYEGMQSAIVGAPFTAAASQIRNMTGRLVAGPSAAVPAPQGPVTVLTPIVTHVAAVVGGGTSYTVEDGVHAPQTYIANNKADALVQHNKWIWAGCP